MNSKRAFLIPAAKTDSTQTTAIQAKGKFRSPSVGRSSGASEAVATLPLCQKVIAEWAVQLVPPKCELQYISDFTSVPGGKPGQLKSRYMYDSTHCCYIYLRH